MQLDTIEDLIYALLNAIGLAINPMDNTIYDQDTGFVVLSGGKSILCSVDPNRPVYPSELSIVFDPFNFKLMSFFMSYFFEKESHMGTFKVLTFSFQDASKNRRENMSTNVRVKLDGNIVVESLYYNNKALKICDIILRLSDSFIIDLYNFDKEMVNR